MNTCRPNNLILLLIICISGAPLIPIPFDISYSIQVFNNWMHIPAFAVLTIVLLEVFKNFRLPGWLRIICVLSVLLLIGIGVEVVQLVIPGRYPSYFDIHLNVVGISFGVFLFLLVEKFKPGLIRIIVCR